MFDLGDGDRLRSDLQAFLGIRPPGPAPDVEILSSSHEDGFARHLVHLVTEDDVIPALLAVPSGPGPFPAAVVFHQHAGQRQFGKSEVFGLVGDPRQAFGLTLARAGFLVLAPDSIAFEDRRPGGPGTDARDDDGDQHYKELTYRLVDGDTLMRKVLEDAMAAVSALLARTDVRPESIAALGHSYGGNTTLFLTAIDSRIQLGCASGALASYRRRMRDGTGIEMAEVIPGLTTRFDLEHVLAATASRPFLVVSATDDEYSIDAPEIVETVQAAMSAPDDDRTAISHLRFTGGHELDDQRFKAITDWIVRTGTSAPRTP